MNHIHINFLLMFTLICGFSQTCHSLAAEVKGKGIHFKIRPETIKQGDAFILEITSPESLNSVSGYWLEKTIQFHKEDSGNIFFAVIGVDLEMRPGSQVVPLIIENKVGEIRHEKIKFVTHKGTFALQRLTLPEKMVTLSEKTLSRVGREKAKVSKVLGSSTGKKAWKNGFIMPVKGKLLSPFGSKRILNNKPRSPHSGIDLKGKLGTPVRASSDGKVVLVGDHYFAGKSIYLDHGMGIISMYFHLSKIHVKKGEKIAQGQVIGRVGSTGRATGPHLHWGIRIGGSRIDPLSLVRLF